jgi:hypothetical protein
MKSVRIKGLVRLMNRTRKDMVDGIPASEIDAFKQMILDTTAFVEELCRKNGVLLSDLPTPTRRAYEYLKRIDLDNLPVRDERDGEHVSSLRISGIVSSCREIQTEFVELARLAPAGHDAEQDLNARLASLHQYIMELASMVDEICEKVGAFPDMMPGPTLRAYQWLTFLSSQDNFDDHFRALKRFCHGIPDAHIEFYNLRGLYRVQKKKSIRSFLIHEAFIYAPHSLVKDLMAAAVSPKDGGHRSRIRQFTRTEEFQEVALSIEMIGIRLEGKARGEVYDLEEVFKRVNKRYFRGRMEMPVLTWNKIITRRKFGHYVPATDTVMISIVLDAKDVPPYVIDHVMHHELLHRKLGVKVVNGRQIAHTHEFRSQEQQFKYFHQAHEFLNKLSLGNPIDLS